MLILKACTFYSLAPPPLPQKNPSTENDSFLWNLFIWIHQSKDGKIVYLDVKRSNCQEQYEGYFMLSVECPHLLLSKVNWLFCLLTHMYRCYRGEHCNNVQTWSIKCSWNLHCRFCSILCITRQETKFIGSISSTFSGRFGKRLYWRCLN